VHAKAPKERTAIRRSLAAIGQLALALIVVAALAPSAKAAASPAPTSALLLPEGSGFICQMFDESSKAWVYCWVYLRGGKVGPHVRLGPDGEVSLSATEAPATGIGGPGEPYGAWETVGRFRCEVLREGIRCVVVATGKGFLAGTKGNIEEVQTPPGLVAPLPLLGQSVNAEPASGYAFIQQPNSKFHFPLNEGVQAPVGTTLDATHGAVRLSLATTGGAVQTGLFRGGVFQVSQPGAGNQGGSADLTVLTLLGTLEKTCAEGVPNEVRSSVQGNFQIDGRYASITASDADWIVSDGCNGTLVKVLRGTVTIRDLLLGTTTTVTAGQTYLAHPDPAANGGLSEALVWRALGGKVICGVVSHVEGKPPTAMLCFARPIPPPPRSGNFEGDPGFAFLRSKGQAHPTRISQYSWIPKNGWLAKNQTSLVAGERWTYPQLDVHCAIAASRVRCVNRSGHGFMISRSSYRGF
jgi:hypothetical protein